jgi:uncharacterized repeat protein (TIGR01451 family)
MLYMKYLKTLFLCFSCLALSSVTLFAQTVSPLEVKLTVLKPGVGADGKPVMVAAAAAEPGQVLTYHGVYHNKSTGELKNIVASLPVPQGLAYVAESASPAATDATIDGTHFFPVATPPKDTTPAQWRELRWSPRNLAAGAEFIVEIRARVPNATP